MDIKTNTKDDRETFDETAVDLNETIMSLDVKRLNTNLHLDEASEALNYINCTARSLLLKFKERQ